jgi:peptidoglycan/LPS O-acetylase OafA/YrhL
VALLVRNAFTATLVFAGMTAIAFDAGRDIVGMRRMAEVRQWDPHQIDAYASFQFNGLFFAAGIVAVFAFARIVKAAPEVQRQVGRLVLGASAVAVVILAWACANEPFAHRWVWAVALAGLVFGLATAPPRFMLHRSVRWAGTRSYSIYLIHGVVILMLERSGFTAWADHSMSWLGFVVCVLVTVVITLCLAALTYRLVELPGKRLGGSSAVVDADKRKVLAA